MPRLFLRFTSLSPSAAVCVGKRQSNEAMAPGDGSVALSKRDLIKECKACVSEDDLCYGFFVLFLHVPSKLKLTLLSTIKDTDHCKANERADGQREFM